MQFAIKLLFETTKLSRLKSFREVCLVRGMTENEFQITRNEILENIHIDVENMSLSQFFNKIMILVEQCEQGRTLKTPLFMG